MKTIVSCSPNIWEWHDSRGQCSWRRGKEKVCFVLFYPSAIDVKLLRSSCKMGLIDEQPDSQSGKWWQTALAFLSSCNSPGLVAGKSFSVLKPCEQRSFNHPLIGFYEKAEDEFSHTWLSVIIITAMSYQSICVDTCVCVCLSVCLCKSVDNEGNHCSSITAMIINTSSPGDFCSAINWAVMTDVHCIVGLQTLTRLEGI